MNKFKTGLGVLGLLLLLSGGVYGISRIVISQIFGDVSSPTGSVAVTLPNSTSSAWVKLGTNLTVTNGVLNASPSPTPTWATEILTATQNGAGNTIITLSNVPLANSQLIMRNGLVLFPSAGDYVISGTTVTFQAGQIPQPGDILVAVYQH